LILTSILNVAVSKKLASTVGRIVSLSCVHCLFVCSDIADWRGETITQDGQTWGEEVDPQKGSWLWSGWFCKSGL